MSQEQKNPLGNAHKLAFYVSLALISMIAILGCVLFLQIWHKGDQKAEAFSGLLAFLAAILASIVTLVYVYLTNASLLKAQVSIVLQQQELDQMRASVDLQRREWEQKVRVVPQFWIITAGTQAWHTGDQQFPATNRLSSPIYRGEFLLRVWNYSEQSFLVNAVELERVDFCGVPFEHREYLQTFVAPHSTTELNISILVMRLITRTSIGKVPENVLDRVPDKKACVGIRLVFTDWAKSDAKTDWQQFEIEYLRPDQPMKINHARSPVSDQTPTPIHP